MIEVNKMDRLDITDVKCILLGCRYQENFITNVFGINVFGGLVTMDQKLHN